ncbi:3-oxoacyl-ACP synthase III family protein [Mucilaginibacter gotjawali]|uniref:3-oxoacyl-[acyl-carrier-protein] synthase-3 n=1 Tax=Mucilaginibacter gotjawali TaxID=1550579 RepID=A0A839SA50_9SPHI|nr:ketoacyl-ACP synthase III [Mucilaginibacter gotjawali]MBB3054716.1 3-oxoacyl-[acyl-carrier-protein] synthase-3 [Mucilaginibacter gotjawali]
MDLKETGNKIYAVIIGSGSYIPTRIITNNDFSASTFYDENGHKLARATAEIIPKFSDITGILERRYVTADLVASDIAVLAAESAIGNAKIDAETLDYIIVAHNFGDIKEENRRSEFVPALASRVKHRLGIKNPDTVCYDLPFGCAGWLQGMIQADFYIHAGQAKRVLVIGAETLSRICDPHDRDSMLYADGAGAVILEATESDTPVGILSHSSHTYAEHAFILRMDKSNNPDYLPKDQLFLKMQGRILYEQALKVVPLVIKESLEKAAVPFDGFAKILLHQANKKMMEAILRRFYDEFGIKQIPENIMPITVSWLGNSSVATLPTLYNLISENQLPGHQFTNGNIIVFASVGAGVNVNSVVYQIPK